MITMPMLVPDLAGGAGDEALAGEFEILAHWMILPVAPVTLLR